MIKKYVMPGKVVKPVYYNIALNLASGFIANFDESNCSSLDPNKFIWIDANDRESYNKHIGDISLTHDGIILQIYIDSECIFDDLISKSSNFDINNALVDSVDHVDHTVTISMSGFEDHHRPLISNNTSARSAIQLKGIWFESLNVIDLYTGIATAYNDANNQVGADSIFSDNTTIEFNFSTPIYRWLIDNQQYILSRKYSQY